MDDITPNNTQPTQPLATSPVADVTASPPPVVDQPVAPPDVTAKPTQDTFTPVPEPVASPSQPEPTQPDPRSAQPVTVGGDDLPNTDILEKDIFELMGIDDLAEDKKSELFGKMMETIEKRVFARVHETLEEADLPKFKELLEASDPDALKAFLTEKGIDLNELMSQEAFVYKAGMADISKPLKDAREQAKNEPVVTATDVENPITNSQPSLSQAQSPDVNSLNNQQIP